MTKTKKISGKTKKLKFIKQLRKAPRRRALLAYLRYLRKHTGRDFNKWQVEDMLDAIKKRTFGWRRTRGGSKTLDAARLVVFMGLMGIRVAWRAGAYAQLYQAREYFQENPFVDFIQLRRVVLINGINISTAALTDKWCRSGRYDMLVADELGSLWYDKDLTNYYSALGMLTDSKYQFVLNISTPKTGSVFDKVMRGYYIDGFHVAGLEAQGNFSHRPHDVCSWVSVDKLPPMPHYIFELEYMAIWASPGGAIFKNLLLSSAKSWQLHPQALTFGGMDFNGPTWGHIYVEFTIYKKDLFVTYERAFRYDNMKKATDEAVEFLEARSKAGVSINVEDGGFNSGYAEHFEACADKILKTEALTSERLIGEFGLTEYVIHLDPKHTPFTYQDFETASFDPDAQTPKPLKGKGISQHYLDAGIMACHHEGFDIEGMKKYYKDRSEHEEMMKGSIWYE